MTQCAPLKAGPRLEGLLASKKCVHSDHVVFQKDGLSIYLIQADLIYSKP